MFQRKDYIVRLVEEIGAVLAKVLALKQAGKADQAHSLITQSLRAVSGLEPQLIDMLPADEIVKLAGIGGNREKLFTLAELLKEQAGLYLLQDKREQAEKTGQKAVRLYELAAENDSLRAKCSAAIAELQSNRQHNSGEAK